MEGDIRSDSSEDISDTSLNNASADNSVNNVSRHNSKQKLN